jgi:gliding motility-associated-like protein
LYAPFPASLVNETNGDTVWSRSRMTLDAYEVMTDSVMYTAPICGQHTFRLQAFPPEEWDQDPTNDLRTNTMEARCADLAALNILLPTIVRKNEDCVIRFSFAEQHNLRFDNAFSVTINVARCGEPGLLIQTFNYPWMAAGGRIDDTLHWNAEVAGELTISLRIITAPGEDADESNNCVTSRMTVLYQAFSPHPQPFTPNGDGYNDELMFDFGDEHFSSPRVNIFGLDGRLVKSLDTVTDNGIRWDGRDRNGGECVPGSYLYTLEDGGQKKASGIIYLAR